MLIFKFSISVRCVTPLIWPTIFSSSKQSNQSRILGTNFVELLGGFHRPGWKLQLMSLP